MRRIAVTGAGVVSPLGTTLEQFYEALAAGRSGIRRLAPEVAGRSGVQVGATVEWDAAGLFKEGEAANLDRVTQFAIAAAGQAIAASGLLADESLPRERIGVSWGTGMGGAHTQEASYQQVYGKGEWRVRPLTVVMGMANAAGSNVAVRHGLRGPFGNYSTACSSSAMALGEAMRTIAAGRADAMIAGGAEALLTPGVLVAWQALRTLATADPANPSASCKPFDRRRTGLVLGEGAAAFVLEEESRARARGARIYALLTGYGNSCDAVHMSRPDRDGQVRAMKEALAEAQLSPQNVGYINAHGTATTVGDVFGAFAREVRVSSTKSLHGHLLGGSGALEFAAALLALERGILPPTGFLDEPDPACGLRHVAHTAERVEPPRAVMSNSFAFGGSNVVLVAARA